jgi:hypothetical protein
MAGRAPVVPKKLKERPSTLPLEERVRARAHEIFSQRGGQDGSDWDDWFQAEEEIRLEDLRKLG